MSISQRHKIVHNIQVRDRLKHDAGGLHVAFHVDGARDATEGCAAEVTDLIATYIQTCGVTDITAKRDQPFCGVVGGLALEGQPIDLRILVSHHLAAVDHAVEVKHDGVA